MGQAKAKKAMREFRSNLAQAMKLVVGATSEQFGVDCVSYARVAEVVLQQLGYTHAVAVAGSTSWRIGPGDGDVISHALSVMQPGMGIYSPAGLTSSSP